MLAVYLPELRVYAHNYRHNSTTGFITALKMLIAVSITGVTGCLSVRTRFQEELFSSPRFSVGVFGWLAGMLAGRSGWSMFEPDTPVS